MFTDPRRLLCHRRGPRSDGGDRDSLPEGVAAPENIASPR